ncbi:hypothetical protein AZA_86290 [Nitrospirillum viridazoti Y2]|nr:hypothetical protein AZA_86290 [Nitrospirillum amazonense Y2]
MGTFRAADRVSQQAVFQSEGTKDQTGRGARRRRARRQGGGHQRRPATSSISSPAMGWRPSASGAWP